MSINPQTIRSNSKLAICGLLIAGLCPVASRAQSSPTAVPAATRSMMAPVPGATELDRIIAIVNGAVLLDSDVEEERTFGKLDVAGSGNVSLPPDKQASWSEAIERLINRELILQQLRLQPGDAISDEQLNHQIEEIQRTLPACQSFHCTDPQGWKRYLASLGLTEDEFRHYWLVRMEVMSFIERRFRMGIRIPQDQISDYYQQKLVPQYKAENVSPPPLSSLSTRIERVLLEQQVSGLLDDWLQSLRAEGTVVILHPEEAVP